MNIRQKLRNLRARYALKPLLARWINKRLPPGIEIHLDLRGITINDDRTYSYASIGWQECPDPNNHAEFGEHLSVVTAIGDDDLDVHPYTMQGIADAINRVNNFADPETLADFAENRLEESHK